MAASGSSSSSFTSSSLGLPPSYGQAYASPGDSSWTPGSAVSALTSDSASAQTTPLRPLDLGPPGYQATIVLFERTNQETTIYLGPWDIRTSAESRCVTWQCSYQGELLEHFLPTDVPTEMHPLTLHAHHRPYSDPHEMELSVSFIQPHRIRYTHADGTVVHDALIEVKYEFTTVDGSIRFQGDLRSRDLVDYFDIDVVWSDKDGRTDRYGSIRGMGTAQRLKLWRDRYSTFHYFSFYANRTDGRFREFQVYSFEGEMRNRDDRHRQLRLYARGRRGSAPDNSRDRRFSISSPFSRQRQRSVPQALPVAEASSSRPSHPTNPHEIRYLGFQFSRNEDYRRFLEQWLVAHSSDSEFRGVPFPPNHIELPSPEILAGDRAELPSPELYRGLQAVPEPPESATSDETP